MPVYLYNIESLEKQVEKLDSNWIQAEVEIQESNQNVSVDQGVMHVVLWGSYYKILNNWTISKVRDEQPNEVINCLYSMYTEFLTINISLISTYCTLCNFVLFYKLP